jgi:hypothetical protein
MGNNLSDEASRSIPPADFPDDDKVQATLRTMANDPALDEEKKEKIAGAMQALSHYVTIHSEILSKVGGAPS